MELKLNVVPLYNVPLLLNNMLVHATLLFNTNLLKYASFVNSNDLVFLKLTHKLIFHNTVLNFLMLLHLFNKLVLLVSLKIFHLQLLLVDMLLSDTVQQPMVKKLVVTVHHQPSKAAATVLVLVVVMVVLLD